MHIVKFFNILSMSSRVICILSVFSIFEYVIEKQFFE